MVFCLLNEIIQNLNINHQIHKAPWISRADEQSSGLVEYPRQRIGDFSVKLNRRHLDWMWVSDANLMGILTVSKCPRAVIDIHWMYSQHLTRSFVICLSGNNSLLAKGKKSGFFKSLKFWTHYLKTRMELIRKKETIFVTVPENSHRS